MCSGWLSSGPQAENQSEQFAPAVIVRLVSCRSPANSIIGIEESHPDGVDAVGHQMPQIDRAVAQWIGDDDALAVLVVAAQYCAVCSQSAFRSSTTSA